MERCVWRNECWEPVCGKPATRLVEKMSSKAAPACDDCAEMVLRELYLHSDPIR